MSDGTQIVISGVLTRVFLASSLAFLALLIYKSHSNKKEDNRKKKLNDKEKKKEKEHKEQKRNDKEENTIIEEKDNSLRIGSEKLGDEDTSLERRHWKEIIITSTTTTTVTEIKDVQSLFSEIHKDSESTMRREDKKDSLTVFPTPESASVSQPSHDDFGLLALETPIHTPLTQNDDDDDDDEEEDDGPIVVITNEIQDVRINSSDHGVSLCDEEVPESSSNSISCSDSGRGSEPEEHRSPILAYHFLIPESICGQFIGTKGVHVNRLKADSKVRVILRESPDKRNQRHQKSSSSSLFENGKPENFQLCIIEGSRLSIEKCLELIRERFPLADFPKLTLEQVNVPPANPPSSALSLVFGVSNLTSVSSIIAPNHLFLHSISHPTFPALERLNDCMAHCYNELLTPLLEVSSIITGAVCVAQSEDYWFRVQILHFDEAEKTVNVKYLDYGGYYNVSISNLRQIRSDFLSLPFQAIECYLANIVPPNGSSEWPPESLSILEEFLSGKIGNSLIMGLSEDNIPFIHFFLPDTKVPEGTPLNINRQLVERNVASWVEHGVV